MIKGNFLSLLFLSVFFSCKAQEIRIVVENGVIVPDNEISIFQIENGKDTLHLKPERPEYYRLGKRDNDIKLIINYKSSSFELSEIDEETKCIYIDYESNAENNCYVVTKIFSDTMQTERMSSLKNCSDITSINLYREFEPKINKGVKIRRIED
ncbi:hypothetical protein N5D03_13945 [Empedobacter sp. GD03861]|uniref:hypothetical protein n=1 Tax=Empedobacter sp. GD03861 TaxID=2975390 RepID=UPI00244A1747|nr:hypothetical protein [Empedobacter sp. GD03861]MDH0675641.1 hypothetical protein [Empedobacter sp. GD03861]